MIIRKIRIDSYRSLYNFGLKCVPLTVLIGRNDAGKSNILRAIQLLLDDKATDNVDRYDWSKLAKTTRYPREITISDFYDLSCIADEIHQSYKTKGVISLMAGSLT